MSRTSSQDTGMRPYAARGAVKRRNPSGSIVWVARYTGRDGKYRIAKPTWNRAKGTSTRKADAQRAIDEAYGLSDRPDTLGAYFATWTDATRDRNGPTRRTSTGSAASSRSRAPR